MRRALCAALAFVALSAASQTVAQTGEQVQFSRAETFFAGQRWREAAEAYRAFIRDYPNAQNARFAYLRLAQAYASMEDDALARQTFSELIRMNPDDPYAQQAVSLWGNVYVQRYQYREAAQMCQEVMRAYPGSRAAEMAHYLLGIYLYSDNRLEDAEKAYRGFLDAFPTSIYRDSAFRQVVSVLVQQGKYADAEAFIGRNMAGSPGDTQWIQQLAEVYMKQERADDAIRVLRSALENRPGDAELVESLGKAYAQKGDRVQALATWMALSGDRSDYNTRQRLGYILKSNGFYTEAVQQYEAAILLQPTFTYLYTQLADIHRIRGDMSGALSVYVRALQTVGLAYSAREPILTAIGELYSPARRLVAFAEAREQIERLYGASLSGDPAAVLTMADLLFGAGQVRDALHWLEKLAALHFDGGAHLTAYAERLAEEDDIEPAAMFYESAVRLYPDVPQAGGRLVSLGRHLLRLERWDDALSALRRAMEKDPQRTMTMDADILLAQAYLHGLRRPHEVVSHLTSVRDMPTLALQRSQMDLLLAEAYLLIGQEDAAGALLRAGAWATPAEQAQAQYLRAEALLFRGDYENAAEAYQEVARAFPSAEAANDALERVSLIRANADTVREGLDRYVAGAREEGRGDFAAARAHYEEVVSRFARAPVSDHARMALGGLALRRGDAPTASENYEAVATAGGSLAAEALLRLGNVYRGAGQDELAARAYERLLEQSPRGAFAVEARRNLRALDGVPH
jgi:tetratricopeptide (TPR) repeat protein